MEIDPSALAEHNPLAHPAVASVRLFDFSTPPGDHLLEFYNSLWRACDPDFPHAPTRIARLMPRGHGKTEGAGVVFPTWVVLSHPDVRVAVISKTKGLAAERTEKAVEYIERYAPQFDIEVTDSSRTQLTTASNDHKEATISPYGLESQLTGKHFDAVIYDDIADWDNQRTETQRRNVRNYFGDYVDNLPSNDSVLPNGPVQAVIGTRKHPQDIYETNILNSATWDVGVYTAIHEADWPVVETRDWQVRGDDGEIYDSIADLPPDVTLANNGVLPNRDVDVLWPEFQPPEALLYDIVDGDDSTAVWQRENQQDPNALAGEVFKTDWLIYEDGLPTDENGEEIPLRWVAGLDIGLVEDPQKAAEQDSDYTALAVVGVDPRNQRAYLDALPRKRGLSVSGIVDWTEDQLADYDVDKLLVEQNAGRGPGQRLRDTTSIPTENVSSSGSKEGRIHSLSADFESGTLRIHGDATNQPWRGFEQNEWLQFPTGAHDDRLDAIELAMRAVAFGNVPAATASLDEGGYTPAGEDITAESREFKESDVGQAIHQIAEQQRGSFR
ncbi:terminase large subunit domain-containing protein [Natronoarchaeum rubrum]|uniref:terminase large subunit domain-containing protein n=1 Tax=Natronoarchaeum rubrum TaxID=755311 RepID=UPI002112465F|nr:terminase family protein [Natronoarchaeum rubrum]